MGWKTEVTDRQAGDRKGGGFITHRGQRSPKELPEHWVGTWGAWPGAHERWAGHGRHLGNYSDPDSQALGFGRMNRALFRRSFATWDLRPAVHKRGG